MDNNSLSKVSEQRAVEHLTFAQCYEKGSDAEKKLATTYWKLVVDYRHLSACYCLIDSPLPGAQDMTMSLCLVYRHLSQNHRELANQHEAIATKESPSDFWHNHLASYHRHIANSYDNYVKALEIKAKTVTVN